MSLYDDIGGAAAVTVAVTVFYTRVTDDPELAPWFGGVDIERLKAHQRAFLTAALGGPDLFTGRTMEAAHAGLGITIEAFDRVLEHLAYTLFDLEARLRPGDRDHRWAAADRRRGRRELDRARLSAARGAQADCSIGTMPRAVASSVRRRTPSFA